MQTPLTKITTQSTNYLSKDNIEIDLFSEILDDKRLLENAEPVVEIATIDILEDEPVVESVTKIHDEFHRLFKDAPIDSPNKSINLTYQELQEEYAQTKGIQNTPKILKDGSESDDENIGIFSRIFYGILMAFVFAIIGFFIDGLVTVVSSIVGNGNGSFMWMFTPIIAIIGFFIGVLSGTNAGANAVDAINIGHSANSKIDDPSISHDILRGIGIAVTIFVVGWIALMIFT